jgi:hypothetical protein
MRRLPTAARHITRPAVVAPPGPCAASARAEGGGRRVLHRAQVRHHSIRCVCTWDLGTGSGRQRLRPAGTRLPPRHRRLPLSGWAAACNPAPKDCHRGVPGALPVVPAPDSEPVPGRELGRKSRQRRCPGPGPAARAPGVRAGCGRTGGHGGGGGAVPDHHGVGGPKVRAGLLAGRAGQPAEPVHTPPGSDCPRPDIGLTEGLRVEVTAMHEPIWHHTMGRRSWSPMTGRTAGLPGRRACPVSGAARGLRQARCRRPAITRGGRQLAASPGWRPPAAGHASLAGVAAELVKPRLGLAQLRRGTESDLHADPRRRIPGAEFLGQPGPASGPGQRPGDLGGVGQQRAQVAPDQLIELPGGDITGGAALPLCGAAGRCARGTGSSGSRLRSAGRCTTVGTRRS